MSKNEHLWIKCSVHRLAFSEWANSRSVWCVLEKSIWNGLAVCCDCEGIITVDNTSPHQKPLPCSSAVGVVWSLTGQYRCCARGSHYWYRQTGMAPECPLWKHRQTHNHMTQHWDQIQLMQQVLWVFLRSPQPHRKRCSSQRSCEMVSLLSLCDTFPGTRWVGKSEA